MTKIQSAALGYGNFGPDPGGKRQAREAICGQGLGHQTVGGQGVDANPPGRAPDKPPGIGGLAPRGRVLGQQDLLPGGRAAGQGTGIRHMDPDAAAVRQLHPGQETFYGAPGSGRGSGAQNNAPVQADRRADIIFMVLDYLHGNDEKFRIYEKS